jgi:hypothetical protein
MHAPLPPMPPPLASVIPNANPCWRLSGTLSVALKLKQNIAGVEKGNGP